MEFPVPLRFKHLFRFFLGFDVWLFLRQFDCKIFLKLSWSYLYTLGMFLCFVDTRTESLSYLKSQNLAFQVNFLIHMWRIIGFFKVKIIVWNKVYWTNFHGLGAHFLLKLLITFETLYFLKPCSIFDKLMTKHNSFHRLCSFGSKI